MEESTHNVRRLLLPLGLLVSCASVLAIADPRHWGNQQTPADNIGENKDQSPPTADQQKMNPTDRALTQQIRKAIHRDKNLSNYARNIKIMTRDGKVTLRGPVRTEEEKTNLQAKAVAVAGEENVTNQLEISPSK